MIITIYFDETRKNRQVIKPMERPDCNISSIVDTVTRGDYHHFDVTG